MGKIVEFPGRPDLVKLAEEYDALVVIGVNENQIQIISNMEDPDILYSMEVAKSELINAYFTDESIH
jgi:hypothetical protein|tara:strand:+ start:862 stop:1062 length:201 start_codon:yes stop_codon:yes gene_type:complete